MSRISGICTLALLSFSALALPAHAAVFGSVVPIGGTSSDIALDESRGVLYIADFGNNVIDVMSITDNTIHSSINVLPLPGAIALSPDSTYLLVAHYCNLPAPSTGASGTTGTTPTQLSPPCTSAITSINLTNNTQQVFSLTDAPLGVAFLGTGQALVVTVSSFLQLNPSTGATSLVAKIADVAKTLPVPLATFPGQILSAALTTSADGKTIWGVASAGTNPQLIFRYSGPLIPISAIPATTTPLLLPRISSAADGSYATVGYFLVSDGGYLQGRYPDIVSSTNITGSAIDSVHGVIYAQFPDANQPTGPATTLSGSATPALSSAMLIMDSDNLTFRDRISIPEDMVGRAVLNAATTMMYAVSESGVMVLPVGSLNSYHRVNATQEDVLVATNFCNRSLLSQSLTITDPGGGQTDFTVTTTQPGVTILPASGTTPATVKVYVDPTVIPETGGTTAVTLNITSQLAVNQPKPVRLLVNNPDPSQRGAIVDQPGVLSDILPDQARSRVYVLRQDMNQLLVFDGTSLNLLATLRTATSPTMMAMTLDGNYLLVAHDDSQLIAVYDLNALQPVSPIVLPGGHYGRSIAISTAAMLVMARNEGASTPSGIIDSIDFTTDTAAALPSLGAFVNSVAATAVLASAPSGGTILLASSDGTVALYKAASNTFVASRKDFASLSGAFAASDYGSYVVGNSFLDSSLVPAGFVNPSPLPTSGFTFVDQGGYMASAASASAAGSLVRVVSLQTGAGSPIATSEAPLLPGSTTTTPVYGTYGSGSTSAHAATSFARTVAPLLSPGTLVLLTTSGLTSVPANFAATVAPTISAIVSAANGSSAVAPGGLVSIYGQNMSTVTAVDSGTPLSTALGNSCTGVNGLPIPLLYVSAGQINAQLPFNVVGDATLVIHTPGGVSNNYSFVIQPTAPSVFISGVAGSATGLALIVRDSNSQLVTPTNPINPKDTVTIYLTGMGATTPSIAAGQPAPSSPLAYAAVQPTISLGGSVLKVDYAGLAPGEIGVYQINATVPSLGVTTGLTVPLVVTQNGTSTTFNVRVVN